MKQFILTIAIAMSVSLYSFSAIITWSGNTNSDFSLSSNWIGNVAPGPTDAVFIPAGSNIVISSATQVTRVIFDQVGGASSNLMVTGSGNLSVKGSSPLFWGENCNIINNGNIKLRSPDGYFGAMMLTTGADFQNNGNLSIDKTDSSFGGAIFMNNGSNFDNNSGATLKIDSANIGVYIWDDGAAVSFSNNNGASVMMSNIKFTGFLGQNTNGPSFPGNLIENDGIINIQTNYPYSEPIQGYGVYFLSSNFCFTNQVGATFNVNQNVPGPVQNNFGSSACVVFNGPMLLTAAEGNNNFTASNNGAIKVKSTAAIIGSGKVSALALDIEGSIEPGPNSGHITFIDNFDQPKVNRFDLELYGTHGAGVNYGNDHVEFNGNISKLNGSLNISLAGNFIPNIGDEFILFKNTNTNGSLNNLFTEVNLPGGSNFWEITESGKQFSIKLVKQMAPCDKLAQAIPLDVTMLSPTEVQLDWDMVAEVDHYEINGRQVAPSLSNIVKINLASNTTSYTVQNIDPHNTYQWMIRPHCDQKELVSGPWSAIKDFTICSPVKNTFTQDITESQAQLNWTPSAENVYGYRIIGSLSGNSKAAIIDLPNPLLSDYTVNDLNPSLKYNWMILQNCGMNVYSDPTSSVINTFQTLSAKRSDVELKNHIDIYPNPATDLISIKTDIESPEWISIFDIQGKEIFHSAFTTTLDISKLESGFYILEISNEFSGLSKPLIIE